MTKVTVMAKVEPVDLPTAFGEILIGETSPGVVVLEELDVIYAEALTEGLVTAYTLGTLDSVSMTKMVDKVTIRWRL